MQRQEEMHSHIGIVSEQDLCIGCGTCVSVCPEGCIRLSMDHRKGLWTPVIDDGACISCRRCLSVCPGLDADYASLTPSASRELSCFPSAGYYARAMLALSRDEDLHSGAASGGLVSSVLIHMLDRGMVDGAVVTVMGASPLSADIGEGDNPALLAQPVLARSAGDIRESQQSKYCPVPAGEIIRFLKSQEGRFAFVGLPCHILALRKWQAIDGTLTEKIPYFLGLFCSRTPSFHATRQLLHAHSINIGDVRRLQYRAGEDHIGYMAIDLLDGSVKKIPHLSFDYWGFMFARFFMPHRCYLCPDKLAACADISFGDDWTGSWHHRRGTSTVIARSRDMDDMLHAMKRKGTIRLRDIDMKHIATSQDLAVKADIAPRKTICRLAHRPVPHYGTLNRSFSDSRQGTFRSFGRALMLFIRCQLSRTIVSYRLIRLMGKFLCLIEGISSAVTAFVRKFVKALKILAAMATHFIPITITPSVKTSRYKLVMMGGYGSRDIGDESMPHADILNLRKILGDDLEIVMLSPDPADTGKMHGERSIRDIDKIGFSPRKGINAKLENMLATAHGVILLLAALLSKRGIHLTLWPAARDVLNEMISADIIFNVGGGNLNSIIPQELYKKGFIYLSARILRKPVIISGQTIGPFEGGMDRLFGRLVLDTVHLITFRDRGISHERCLDIGVSQPRMHDAADDAMTIPTIDRKHAEDLLLKDVDAPWYEGESKLTVAMNFKGSLRFFRRQGEKADLSRECLLMASIADTVAERYDARIVFIPTDYCPGVDDREMHREIIAAVRHRERITALSGEYDDTTLKGIIGLCDAVIGSRYHFCVFAASLLIPFSGIASGVYQQTKLRGLADLCGVPRCFVEEDMEFARIEDVWPKISWMLDNRERIRMKLKENVPSLEEKSLSGVHEAVRVLKQS